MGMNTMFALPSHPVAKKCGVLETMLTVSQASYTPAVIVDICAGRDSAVPPATSCVVISGSLGIADGCLPEPPCPVAYAMDPTTVSEEKMAAVFMVCLRECGELGVAPRLVLMVKLADYFLRRPCLAKTARASSGAADGAGTA